MLNLRLAERKSDPQAFPIGLGIHPARRGGEGLHLSPTNVAAVERGGRLAPNSIRSIGQFDSQISS